MRTEPGKPGQGTSDTMPDGAPVSGPNAPGLPQRPTPETGTPDQAGPEGAGQPSAPRQYQPAPGQPIQGQPIQGQPIPGQPVSGPAYQPQPGPGMTPPAQVPARSRNGMAVASLVLGITGLVSSFLLVLGLLTLAQTVLAIVFGSRGLTQARQGAGRKGMATAGLVCGLVGLAFYLVWGIATGGRLLLI